MDDRYEQRVTIKCCFITGLSATETLVLVQKACGNEALNRLNIFRCYSRFRDGRGLIEYDKRGSRPKSTRTEVNIAAVAADLLKNYRRIPSRTIEESFNILKTVVLRILKESFCSRDFFLLHDKAPAHEAASVCKFLTPKNVTSLYQPRTLQIYLRQTIFWTPSWKWSSKDLNSRILMRSKKL
jgi:hypothetical protein